MKRWVKILIGVLAVVIVGLVFAGNYFYNYAVVPSEKDFLAGDTAGTDKERTPSQESTWFTDENNRTLWEMDSTDGLKLSAIYLPAESKTNKTAILAHGYMGTAETMATFAKLYHDLGYNVLAPDARGHGKSQGDYIGFGWPERKDYLQWIDRVLTENGEDEEITLFGISMGGATVMMTSGEDLPKNVKAIVEDCGYASVTGELSYQLKELFNLPSFPLIPVTSVVTKVRAGYFFGEADAIKQLKNNKTPMLFIHGDGDTFVPYTMLDEVYEATDVEKEKYVVPGAEHAKAYDTDPAKYKEVVKNFLEKYID
ncbi:alpha/beta hydrolase [Enterococcus sp. JM4C]|uniref:alpha/beta hydrolase n=1 Tax=Candidatus Enterococcus huntleyi TaxID=1857217 RepID=UPI0013799046|nr:alpha/beta hydrolase [Enterococcus sp. JM4C]KAF1296606.1 alpha/beta hydrolase [Enterococcus sp. JM4C]